MAEYVVSEWDVPPDKITVIPCCVDVQGFSEASSRRHATRAELSLSDRLVVAYCGSLHRWQVPERSLETFRQIGQLHSNAHLLSITTHPERMRHLAQEQGLSTAELTVLSVPHSEVPRYLAAADLGLLLRERSLVNRVASPVKLGEYLASGLPVIMSDEIGDYSDLARRENVGLVLPCDGNHRSVEAQLRGFLDAYWACPETWRARCREVARVHLDSAVHLPKIAALYDRLSREGSE